MGHRGTFIENEAAYERAIARRIRENRRKTMQKLWAQVPDRAVIDSFLLGSDGPYGDTRQTKNPGLQAAYEAEIARLGEVDGDMHYWHERDCIDEAFDVRYLTHPIRQGMFAGKFGEFLKNLQDELMEFGGLSEKQADAVRKAIAARQKRLDERAAKAAERRASQEGSRHIGAIGERRVFDLTVGKVIEIEGQYGTSYLHLCTDADGNVVIYKGTNRFDPGPLRVKATVKAHEDREGIRQTRIARPVAA